MPVVTKQLHKFGFFVGATGITDFSYVKFTLEGVVVSSTVSASLTFHELSAGFYYASYTPDLTGEYTLAIASTSHPTFGAIEIVDIGDEVFIQLTQDTGGVGALKPSIPIASNPNVRSGLEDFILMVFSSSDWDVGRKSALYAQAMTSLDENGNWLTIPLMISPGKYHVVIRNNFGLESVIAAYLEV